MDQTHLTKVFDLLSPRFLLLLPLLFFILKCISSPSSKNQSLPPGPKPWPILGNLLHLGKKPHISMASFAKIHGPLISLKLGKQLLVVGSSKRAATEILKSHDRLLSARYVSKAALFENHVLDRIAIVWATQCSDGWKSLRALCRNELFSATAIESQAVLREKKIEEMVEFIGRREGEVVRIGEVVFAIVFNTIANLLFSVDLIGLEDDGAATGLKSLMWRMMKLGATPNIADFYPILGGIDLQGLKRKMAACVNQMFGVWGKHIKERREKHVQDGPRSDFLDVFLTNGFEDLQINWLAMASSFDYSQSAISLRLVSSKCLLKDIDQTSFKKLLNRKEISWMFFLQMDLMTCNSIAWMVMEKTLQLQRVEWVMSELLKNKEIVKKETRGSNLDFKFLPFGPRRRIYAGLAMATGLVHLSVATLVGNFDWSLAIRISLLNCYFAILLFSSPLMSARWCAICKMEYESGDRLITLPCDHDDCIKKWLENHKLHIQFHDLCNVFDHRLLSSATKLTAGGKSLQTIGRNGLFSATAIESHAVSREDKSIRDGWDPRGLKRKCSACIGEMFAIWRESASRKEENQIHDPPKEMLVLQL
ncbi:hypothetical protein SADUNF_Sadunf15G0116600 [Salix dunnii]|uniref:Cytochrome P450 n=1 Tax=Salix dunnii TaxID=1413687 RepID=A0A835JF76_9ROSI|nr:hypothetical protein SADUNF_Sadunf15G0116600 [Salix dunnii]